MYFLIFVSSFYSQLLQYYVRHLKSLSVVESVPSLYFLHLCPPLHSQNNLPPNIVLIVSLSYLNFSGSISNSYNLAPSPSPVNTLLFSQSYSVVLEPAPGFLSP